ncbi:hypothetical protein Golax_016481, partial [Gossypium laxum]|nr:hypothetical protein [Gossypium laxum]
MPERIIQNNEEKSSIMFVSELINHQNRQWDEQEITWLLGSEIADKNSTVCPKCLVGIETLEHIFRVCPSVNDIRKELHIVRHSDFLDALLQNWLIHILDVSPLNIYKKDTIYKVESYLKELDAVHEKLPLRQMMCVTLLTKNTTKIRDERWKPSDEHCLKINCDTAFHEQAKKSCTWIVVRDRQSNVIGSQAVLKENIPLAFVTEALACLYAVVWGWILDYMRWFWK